MGGLLSSPVSVWVLSNQFVPRSSSRRAIVTVLFLLAALTALTLFHRSGGLAVDVTSKLKLGVQPHEPNTIPRHWRKLRTSTKYPPSAPRKGRAAQQHALSGGSIAAAGIVGGASTSRRAGGSWSSAPRTGVDGSSGSNSSGSSSGSSRNNSSSGSSSGTSGTSETNSSDPANLISVVVMNWQRPGNVILILDQYVQYPLVFEIVVLMLRPDTAFDYVHPKVRILYNYKANKKVGLSARFLGCLATRAGQVLIQDDDLFTSNEGLAAMLAARTAVRSSSGSSSSSSNSGSGSLGGDGFGGSYSSGGTGGSGGGSSSSSGGSGGGGQGGTLPSPATLDPTTPQRLVGCCGRDWMRERPSYVPVHTDPGPARLMMTIMMLTDRPQCAAFFRYAPLVSDIVKLGKPLWNGEDIFFSLVAYKTTGLLPAVVPFTYTLLSENSTGVHTTFKEHVRFRSTLLRVALKRLHIIYPSGYSAVGASGLAKSFGQLAPGVESASGVVADGTEEDIRESEGEDTEGGQDDVEFETVGAGSASEDVEAEGGEAADAAEGEADD